jgi:signal transduction histidine kinase
MNPVASHLVRRVLAWQALFSLLGALLVALLTPRLLLLSGTVGFEGASALGGGVLAGGVAAAAITGARLYRYRFLLRALAVGSRVVEAHQLYEIGDEPRRAIVGWLAPSAVGAAVATIPFAPRTLDPSTSVTLCLLGLAIVSAASLPLFVLLRTTFARALMLAPVEVMREVVEDAERLGHIRGRVSRRMVVAVTLPVVCLALGSMLIVAGHLRRADERGREETARMLARAALEPGPGAMPAAGIPDAVLQARALGFFASSQKESDEYKVERGRAGTIRLTVPLDHGSASVDFSGSTVAVVNGWELVVALCASAIAVLLGIAIGRALGSDLRSATRDVRELGTETVGGGLRVLGSARFRVVAELGAAVARLAGRFRVFARAQERSIDARNAAARTRGLFFASVSHDLKSPLNAILGFTELVRRAQPVSQGQGESLELIERRGRELLALIETILDAARVEAGQLTLVLDAAEMGVVLEQAVQKGRDLLDDREVQVVVELLPGVRKVRVDRERMPRALATFVAYAMRQASTPSLRVVAAPEASAWVRLDIEIPSEHFDEAELAALLDPPDTPGAVEHRGLALALRLGRSIVELHGGMVIAARRAGIGVFSLLLPAEP